MLSRSLAETTTTIITVEEELSGWYTLLRSANSPQALAGTYRRMTQTVEALSQFRLLSFTEAAIARFDLLRRQHPRTGRNDLRIAAICLENQVTLVTRNVVDFQQIDGLLLADWSV